MNIRLVNIYDYDPAFRDKTLYRLLKERPANAAISHTEMPSKEQHTAFVESRPYMIWYFITPAANTDQVVGTIYLTNGKSGHLAVNEVGIQLFKAYRCKGIGREAINELRQIHTGPLYANIAPGNEVSKEFFASLGFRKIQETWKI